MAVIPHRAIVKSENILLTPSSGKTAPEKSSSKMRTKGIIVIADVVFFATVLIQSDIISDEYVIRKNVMTRSSAKRGVTIPFKGNFIPEILHTPTVIIACKSDRDAW